MTLFFVLGCSNQQTSSGTTGQEGVSETTKKVTTESNKNNLSAPAKKSNVTVEVATTVESKAEYLVKEVRLEEDASGQYVTGVVTNDSSISKKSVYIKVPAYDADGNKIGDASDYVSNLNSKASWKFKARYYGKDKNVTFKADEIKVEGFNE
ncbi:MULTISPECIES: FxLYD domain-containing protein [unclassified Gemella]|uniref:FxLYD domain-containing protein n=1 Tax=unclassified Gemella TaxID=2624949 RepID=UPI0015D04CC6|nr:MULTISPECIES: FxLYD domain-containing protein [unclassified Gemella]MBF0710321.1 hypothetical protein [Gemella sp. GL1.1]NYS27665.1 hypothetical protein [Gemella sp. GL1]